MRKALCVGINDYPGTENDLHGCVNDANEWCEMFESLGFDEVRAMSDYSATAVAVLLNLESLILEAEAGDVIVFTYSGHGTYTWDESGDEPDYYDEALYVYDGMILDDELRGVIDEAAEGVHIVVILDSCFSGTATRLSRGQLKPRFVPPEHAKPSHVSKRRRLLAEADMVEVLMSGCSDSEYGYDAYFGEEYHGAFSYYAKKTFLSDQTYKEWHEMIRAYLPSDYFPQTPQLEGSEENKNRIAFQADGVEPSPEPEPEPQPEPEPEPTEEPEESTGLHWMWWVLFIILACGAGYLLKALL